MQFTKAVKHEAKLRMALIGPAGSGKTMTALKIAQHLGARVAVMDTEHGSAAKYADLFAFDTFTPDTFSPMTYIEAIEAAGSAGYDVLILDSLSHAWSGKEGALEQVDKITKRSQSGNSYMAWRDVTPLHNKMIDAILAARVHVIATMRTKTEYVMETNEKGKVVPKKVGLQPVQRDGMEYEFDVIADLDADNNLIVGKTRCPQLHGQMFAKAGQDVADVLKAWLTGAPMPELPAPKVMPEPSHTNGGGKAAGNSDGPTKPSDALTYVNSRVEVPYDNISHLFNAIKGEMNGEFAWPNPKNLDAWAIAIDAAIRHANAKVKAEAQPAMALQGEQAQATMADLMDTPSEAVS